MLEGSWGHQSDYYFFAEKVEVGGHLCLSALTTLDLSTAMAILWPRAVGPCRSLHEFLICSVMWPYIKVRADPEQDVAVEKKGWGGVGWVNLTKTVCLASTSTNFFCYGEAPGKLIL